MMQRISVDELRQYIKEDGMILLNQSPDFPNLENYGGSWDDIMQLIEEREVFFSKFFRKRTTYLSREMYLRLKPLKQQVSLNSVEEAIFNLLAETDGADTEFIKNTLLIEKSVFNKAMDTLLQNLYLTVLRKGKSLNDNWSTLIWGTYLQWEEGLQLDEGLARKECREFVEVKLGNFLSLRQIDNLLK